MKKIKNKCIFPCAGYFFWNQKYFSNKSNTTQQIVYSSWLDVYSFQHKMFVDQPKISTFFLAISIDRCRYLDRLNWYYEEAWMCAGLLLLRHSINSYSKNSILMWWHKHDKVIFSIFLKDDVSTTEAVNAKRCLVMKRDILVVEFHENGMEEKIM